MKTLRNAKCKFDGNTFTMTCDVVDIQFDPRFTQRQTFTHLNPENMRHHRHIQGSQEAIFVKHRGIGVAIPHDIHAAIATAIEPTSSYAPIAKSSLTSQNLTVDIGSELEPDLQWEVSITADDGKTYSDYSPIPGQNTNTLDVSKVKKGDMVRLKATSEAGGMTTNAVRIL